ncbi:hypothetical protein Mp_1g00870 [Marchantia polymorpha subsp. ruderalis]|uniref:Uncharacterized protein n=2 Tax=Marchantia polymorpha TaxID=3197 RepID=A0AAF6AK38_MARPO|nr:hypothetical protein MARPO_0103s0002 [Marchantia polymorpha]BBM96808.1 hypothetical protein Mp_1g00870 [Marchantia polymorpha subsp. ruderalis]|eukprot:PTQ32020.1 hypothetical protein MARPO_0103s0002 [Marchantia polymorpha]
MNWQLTEPDSHSKAKYGHPVGEARCSIPDLKPSPAQPSRNPHSGLEVAAASRTNRCSWRVDIERCRSRADGRTTGTDLERVFSPELLSWAGGLAEPLIVWRSALRNRVSRTAPWLQQTCS